MGTHQVFIQRVAYRYIENLKNRLIKIIRVFSGQLVLLSQQAELKLCDLYGIVFDILFIFSTLTQTKIWLYLS